MPDKPTFHDLMAHIGYLLLRWGWLEARVREAGADIPAELDDVRLMRKVICHGLTGATSDPSTIAEPELRCTDMDGKRVRYTFADLDDAIRKLEGWGGRPLK